MGKLCGGKGRAEFQRTKTFFGEARCGRRRARKILAAALFRHNIRHPMADDDLRDSIKTMMVENLMLKVSKDEIGDDLPLFGPDGLGLDSIDALELVVSLEKKFGVSVPNSETARTALATVDSIHSYVLANRKPGA
jgi:acyl carrier protein